MNPAETNAAINRIKALDLQIVEKDEVLGRISELKRHASIVLRLPADTVICRSVNNFLPEQRYPVTIQEVSYNPDFATCRFNRANWEGDSVFYGSISDDIMMSYHTSGLEISGLMKNPNPLCSETVFVGKWVLQHDTEFVFVGGGDNLLKKTERTIKRNEALVNHIVKYPENVLSLKLIDSFLCNEFSKNVEDGRRWEYKLSAGYSTLVKGYSWPGILYPSVQSNGAGLNIAIFPQFVDDGLIKLEYIAASIYYKRDKDIVNEYVMEARPDGEKLIWKEIYHHKLPPKMKAYYTGKSDDNSFGKYIPMTDLG